MTTSTESNEQVKASIKLGDSLRLAVLPADKLRILRDDFHVRQATIAAATGTTDRTVRTWESGAHVISPTHAERLGWVADVVAVISECVIGHGVDQWLNARLRLIDGRRSTELIAEGFGQDAIDVAKSFVEGSFV